MILNKREETEMKKILTIVGVAFLLLIILGAIMSNNDPLNSVVDTTGSGDITVTLEEYNSIKTGMTYEQVQEIVGGAGVVSSESHTDGIEGVMEDIDIKIISYNGEGSLGANCLFTFTNNKLDSKAQHGLR